MKTQVQTMNLAYLQRDFPGVVNAAKKLIENPQMSLSQRLEADAIWQLARAQGREGLLQYAIDFLSSELRSTERS